MASLVAREGEAPRARGETRGDESVMVVKLQWWPLVGAVALTYRRYWQLRVPRWPLRPSALLGRCLGWPVNTDCRTALDSSWSLSKQTHWDLAIEEGGAREGGERDVWLVAWFPCPHGHH